MQWWTYQKLGAHNEKTVLGKQLLPLAQNVFRQA